MRFNPRSRPLNSPPQGSAPPARSRLSGVEALRGIAALLVVTMHAGSVLREPQSYGALPLGGFFAFGRAGVDFFFVLSGFIITFVHHRDLGHAAQFGSFWRKRLLRIYPSWWIVSGLYAGLLFLSPTRGREEQEIGHAIASFFLLPETIEPILGVGWSLRHELLFYALFSALLIEIRTGIVLFALWAAGILVNMGVQVATGAPLFGGIAGALVFRGFNIEFFFGIATALAVRAGVERHPRLAQLVGATGFLATGMLESFTSPVMLEWPPRHIAYALSAALVLYGTAVLDRAGRSRTPPLLLRLGTASYSIYLVHVPVLLVADYALRTLRADLAIPIELAFCGLVVCAAAVGTVFSETVEQPLLRLGRSSPRPCPSPKALL